MKKIKVYLYGHLRNKVPNGVELEAETAADAINILCQRYPQLKAPLDIGRWKIKIKDYDTKESLFLPLFTDELHIYPAFKLKKSSWVTITLAVVAIIVGAVTGQEWLVYAGVSMLASGVTSLLTPTPEFSKSTNDSVDNSKYLGAPKNTTEIGTRIPICYGLFKIYGHYISFDVSAVDTIKKTVNPPSFTSFTLNNFVDNGNVEVING